MQSEGPTWEKHPKQKKKGKNKKKKQGATHLQMEQEQAIYPVEITTIPQMKQSESNTDHPCGTYSMCTTGDPYGGRSKDISQPPQSDIQSHGGNISSENNTTSNISECVQPTSTNTNEQTYRVQPNNMLVNHLPARHISCFD